MSTLDTLVVKLDADVAPLQAQLDRAKTQLNGFNTAVAPTERALANVGRASSNSTAQVNKMREAMLALTTQMSGANPIVGRLSGALAGFAISAGPMIAILAGLSAVAFGYKKITEEARETKKAVEDSIKALADLTKQKQAPQLDQIKAISDHAGRLREQLSAVRGGISQRETLGIDNEKLRDLRSQEQYLANALDRADRKISELQLEVGGIVVDRIEAIADSTETSAKKAADAWRKAFAEMEASAAQRVAFTPDLDPAFVPSHRKALGFADMNRSGMTHRPETVKEAGERMGFNMDFLGTSAGQAADALAALPETMKKLALDTPPKYVSGSTPGGIDRLAGNLKSMLDPRTILSGVATGFVSTGINVAVSALSRLATSVLDLGNAAGQAALKHRAAIQSLSDALVMVSGSATERAFIGIRNRVSQLGGVDLSHTQNQQQMIAALTALRDAWTHDPKTWERLNSALALAQAEFDALSKTVGGLNDSMRNIPAGFKINLATFNATDVSGAGGNSGGYGLWNYKPKPVVVHIVAEPEGVFRVVEGQAVRKIRSGGTLAWEVVG